MYKIVEVKIGQHDFARIAEFLQWTDTLLKEHGFAGVRVSLWQLNDGKAVFTLYGRGDLEAAGKIVRDAVSDRFGESRG